MKYLIVTFLSLFLSLATFAQSPSAENAIKGIWSAPEMDKSQIEVYKGSDGLYYGKIIASEKTSTIGKIMLQSAKYDTNTKIWKGELVRPDNGMILTAEMNLEPNGKLKVKGSKFFVTKTFYWTKLN